jgi:hypothetical protein
MYRFLRIIAAVISGVVLLGLCAATADAKSLPRVAGLAKAGQVASKAKVKVRWHAVPGARYQMRVAAAPKRLARAHVIATRVPRAYTPRLVNRKTYYVQVRALRGGAKGRWSRVKAVRLVKSAAVSVHHHRPPSDPNLGPVRFSSVAAMKASGLFHIPSDANLVTWHFGNETLEQVFMTLGANDILVLPERPQPYLIDSSDGFRASGVGSVLGANGKRIPIVNTYRGKAARTWFAMARATRGILGMGPGSVIATTNSGFKQEKQIPDKGSPLPGGGTSPGRSWYNTAGVRQGELVGSAEKVIEAASANAYFGNFTMHGRDFGGVAYNGISMKGGTAERLDLDGAWRGFEAVPNGEAGAISVNGGRYLISHVSTSPLNEQGKRVGASPIMINSSPGGRWEYGDASEAYAGMPTIWHSSGKHVWYNITSRWGGPGVNLEQAQDGFQFEMVGGKLWPNRNGQGGHPSPDGIYSNSMHIALNAMGRATITLKNVDLDRNIQAGKLCVQLYNTASPSKVRITATNGGRNVPVVAYGPGGVARLAP